MKTVRILMLAALSLSLFACQKETAEKESVLSGNKSDEHVQPSEPVTPEREKVAMTFDGNVDEDTKTSLEGLNIRWSSSDNITIFADGDANEFLVKKVEEGGKSATFQGYAAVTDTYYALSPVQEMASISGGVITARIDGEQTAVANSFGAEANVSIAQTGGSRLDFKNVGSLVSITLGDDADNDNITAIEITSKDGTPLAGQVNITYNEGAPELSTLNGSPTVRLSGDFEKGNTYYFVVLPGTHASGLTLTFYKPGYKAVYNNSNSATFTRNKYRSFGKTPFNPQSSGKWSGSDFVVGTDMYIDGLGTETGQKGVYTAADGYWDYTEESGGDATAFSDQTGNYNYEWFTQLTAGQKYWLRGGGHYFSVSADGNSVSEITGPSEAVGTVASTDVYRIRVNLPSGNAYVQKVTAAYYKHCWSTANNRELTYAGRGVWKRERMPIRRDCNNSKDYDNRYKFYFTIGGNDQQYGTRHTTDSAPTKETPTTYWYLQPCVTTSFDSKFKLPSWLVDNDHDERYLADLVVYMNAEKAHYTHAFENAIDQMNLPDIVAGEDMFIGGSTEAGQKMTYVGASGFYNTSMNNFGDVSGLDANAIGDYNYEIYTRLTAGQNFYFTNAAGNKYFAPASDGCSVEKISTPGNAAYSAAESGVWRIRANFSTGKCSIRRISFLRFELQYHNSVNYSLDYAGKGVWKTIGQSIEWGTESWDAHLRRYILKIFYDRNEAGGTIDYWQILGATNNKNNTPPAANDDGSYWNIEPYTEVNWDQILLYGDWLIDNDNNGRYRADVSVFMNADFDHYTHRFTNIIDTSESLPSFSAGEKVTIEGDGAAEAGQELSYVATDGYWTTVKSEEGDVVSGDVDTFDGQTYNYEIFTKLTAGKKIYFKAENGALFALSDGNTVGQVRSSVDGSWTAAADGIYRIRLNLPSSTAYIVKVNSVSFFYCNDQTSTEMTYFARGVWKLKNHILAWQPASYKVTRTETRYHFRFNLNGTNQDYGRHQASYSIPSTERDGEAFNVQPTKVLQWDPSFNYPSTLADASFRDGYKVDINLYMNNNNSNAHYSHEIYNEVDRRPSGSVTSYSVSGSGTEIGASSSLTLSDHYMPVGTDAKPVTSRDGDRFEIFRRFYASGDFFLRDNTGAYYIARSNNTLDKSVDPVSVTGILEDGIYDMDFNSSALTLKMTRIYGAALFWHPFYLSANYREMTYNGSGYWKTDKFQWSTWGYAPDRGVYRNDDRYRFIMFTNSDYKDVDHQGTAAGWVWGKVDGQSHYNAYRFPYGGMTDDWTHCWKPLDGSGDESDNVLRDKYVVFWLDLTGNYRHHIDVSDN